jgi:IMP cyclohydrolase
VSDTSLIIYFPVKHYKDIHIVTNGVQTDTIHESISRGGTFADGLKKWTFEPDPPNYTPRISGILYAGGSMPAYELAILKAIDNDPERETRQYFSYAKASPGIGHCLTTYENDGSPLPSFEGEPCELELFDSAQENAARYWDLLNEQNRISILAKTIRISDGEIEIKIINKHK